MICNQLVIKFKRTGQTDLHLETEMHQDFRQKPDLKLATKTRDIHA